MTENVHCTYTTHAYSNHYNLTIFIIRISMTGVVTFCVGRTARPYNCAEQYI